LLEAVLTGMTMRVMLDRSHRETVAFESEIELQGKLSAPNRTRLLDVAGRCPVRRTFSSHLTVRTTTRTPSRIVRYESTDMRRAESHVFHCVTTAR